MKPKTKTCCHCKQTLPINRFGVWRKSNDNLRYRCKKCMAAYTRSHRSKWPSRSREARAAQSRKRIERGFKKKYYYGYDYKQYLRRVSRILFPVAKTCVIDNCNKVGERHHLTYDDPNNFIWLCLEHHHCDHFGSTNPLALVNI